MMKQIVWAALLLPGAAFAQKTYTVEGKIGELNSPAKMYMYYHNAKGEDVFDSTEVSKGNFKFEGLVDKPVKASIMLARTKIKFKWFKEVMVNEKDDIDFRNESIDISCFYLEPGQTTFTSTDSLFRAKFNGSQLNNDCSELNQDRVPILARLKNVIATFNIINREGQITGKQVLDLEKSYKQGLADLQVSDLKFAKDHPSSAISLDMLNKYIATASIKNEIEPVYKSFKPGLKNSDAGKLMAKQIEKYKTTEIGEMAPVFTQPDTAGKTVSLASYRGKYVFVDFWASWCGPCRNENPAVVYAYNTFKDKNFTIVSVSLDKLVAKGKWLQAIKDDHTGQWTQVSDLKGGLDNSAAALYHVSNIPENFLIGPDGKIIAKNLHGSALQETLKSLLK